MVKLKIRKQIWDKNGTEEDLRKSYKTNRDRKDLKYSYTELNPDKNRVKRFVNTLESQTFKCKKLKTFFRNL